MIPTKKKILFVCHDPGGANLILPIVEELREGYEISLLTNGISLKNFEFLNNLNIVSQIKWFDNPLHPKEKLVNPESIELFIDSNRFDLIFTATSFVCNAEFEVIKAARKRNVTTISYVDYWLNYRERFTRNSILQLPDILLVTDQKMKLEIEKEFPDSKIVIVGNAHFCKMIQKESSITPLYNKFETMDIYFFSENLHHFFPDQGWNEMTLLEEFLPLISNQDFIHRVVIKLHPLESKSHWDRFLFKNSKKIDNFEKVQISEEIFKNILGQPFIALGVSSMALLECSLKGYKTISYQPNYIQKDLVNLPYEEYGIPVVKNPQELLYELNFNKRFENVSLDIHKNSMDSINKLLESII